VDTFKQAHPQVQVKITEGGFDEQQFLSAVASGAPPDLVYVDREIIGTYAARGAIQPLDQCISSAGIDMGQYRPAAVQQVTVDGKVYGIPEFYSVRVMIINNKAVSDAGLRPGDVDTSDWSKLAGMAEKLTRTQGGKLQRVGFDPKIPEFLPLWVKANGGALLSDDGKTAQLNDPKVVEALQTTAGVVQANGGWSKLKSLRDSFDFFGAKNQFAKDQLGAFPMEDWYLNVLAEASPDVDITVAPFKDRQGNPLTFVTGSAWAIPKEAKNPDAACRFAKTMTEASTWVAAARARAEARAKKNLPSPACTAATMWPTSRPSARSTSRAGRPSSTRPSRPCWGCRRWPSPPRRRSGLRLQGTRNKGRRSSGLSRQEARWAWLFLAPWVIGFLVFTGGPMIASLVLSFTEYDVISAPQLIGLDNYRQLMADPAVAKSLGNTVFYTALQVPLAMGVSLGLALLLRRVGRASGLFRTIFYLPPSSSSSGRAGPTSCGR
jgi:ABC-type glycerol-3-phosphate transport system substrate-binding protein